MAPEPTGNPQQISAAVQEVTERAQLLIREEIELAKAEVAIKAKRLVRGAVIGAVAGVFALVALVMVLQGFAWLIYYVVPFGNNYTYFWGFFIMAAILLVLGALAGFVAGKAIKSGTPPTPELAIEQAQKIKQTVKG